MVMRIVTFLVAGLVVLGGPAVAALAADDAAALKAALG